LLSYDLIRTLDSYNRKAEPQLFQKERSSGASFSWRDTAFATSSANLETKKPRLLIAVAHLSPYRIQNIREAKSGYPAFAPSKTSDQLNKSIRSARFPFQEHLICTWCTLAEYRPNHLPWSRHELTHRWKVASQCVDLSCISINWKECQKGRQNVKRNFGFEKCRTGGWSATMIELWMIKNDYGRYDNYG
jgi:hypothetical protein